MSPLSSLLTIFVLRGALPLTCLVPVSVAQQPFPMQRQHRFAATPRTPAGTAPLLLLVRHLTFACDADTKVIASTGGATTRIIVKKHIYTMKQVSADAGTAGNNFSDGSVIWWKREAENILEDDSKPDKKQGLAKGCYPQAPATPAPPNSKP